MQYHTLSLLNEYDVNVHVFAQSNDLQGFIPDLLEFKTAGRLQLWRITEMYAPPPAASISYSDMYSEHFRALTCRHCAFKPHATMLQHCHDASEHA